MRVYYAVDSLVTVRRADVADAGSLLERIGLAFTSATPSIALFAGGLGALFAPGLESAIVARGPESVFRSSLFRSGYEVFYTPIPTAEKRAAKSIIDVGFDRMGDARRRRRHPLDPSARAARAIFGDHPV